jgi:hypothetical protein
MVKGMLRIVTAGIGAIMLAACSTGGGDRAVTFDTGAQLKQLELRPMAAQQEFIALSSKTAEPASMIKPMSNASDVEPVSAAANTLVNVSAQERVQEQLGASQHCPGRVGYSSLDD